MLPKSRKNYSDEAETSAMRDLPGEGPASFRETKGVMTMNQKASDQGWQQLQSHIEGFFSQTLRGDGQRIEYKPRFIVNLRESPSERQQIELREMGT